MTKNQTISKSCFVDTHHMIYCCLASGHGYNTLHYITDLLDLINLVWPTGFLFETAEM